LPFISKQASTSLRGLGDEVNEKPRFDRRDVMKSTTDRVGNVPIGAERSGIMSDAFCPSGISFRSPASLCETRCRPLSKKLHGDPSYAAAQTDIFPGGNDPISRVPRRRRASSTAVDSESACFEDASRPARRAGAREGCKVCLPVQSDLADGKVESAAPISRGVRRVGLETEKRSNSAADFRAS
jgi:hypothetical protein